MFENARPEKEQLEQNFYCPEGIIFLAYYAAMFDRQITKY